MAGSLALKLLPAEQARLAAARLVNPEAYDAVRRGRQHLLRGTPQDLDTARFNLDTVVEFRDLLNELAGGQ